MDDMDQNVYNSNTEGTVVIPENYFNATSILKEWNSNHPDSTRDMDNFWKSTGLKDFMSEIAKNETDTYSNDFAELKNMFSVTSRGRFDRGGGTWISPLLFLKFVAYLCPKLEYYALKSLYNIILADSTKTREKFFQDVASAICDVKRDKRLFKTYVMEDGKGIYKIGKSVDPLKREMSLSCGNPNIRLLFSIDYDIENELHKKFAAKRTAGEWFKLNQEDLDYIRKYKPKQH